MHTLKSFWLYVLGYKPNVMILKFENTFALLCDAVNKETSNMVIFEDYDFDQL